MYIYTHSYMYCMVYVHSFVHNYSFTWVTICPDSQLLVICGIGYKISACGTQTAGY